MLYEEAALAPIRSVNAILDCHYFKRLVIPDMKSISNAVILMVVDYHYFNMRMFLTYRASITCNDK